MKRRVDAELASQIVQIAANFDASGPRPALRSEPADPRFQRPFGGLYWQVEPAGGSPLRSRSLWDEALPPPPSEDVTPVSYEAPGPQDRGLLLRAETLRLPAEEGSRACACSSAWTAPRPSRP